VLRVAVVPVQQLLPVLSRPCRLQNALEKLLLSLLYAGIYSSKQVGLMLAAARFVPRARRLRVND